MTTLRESPPRRFQFRLRTLLVAGLVLSLTLSWFAVKLQFAKARTQELVVDEIKAWGGDVAYASELDPRAAPRRGYSDEVVDVYLSNTRILDTSLEPLSKLTHLRLLMLDGTHVTDTQIVHLQELGKLEYLDLWDTQVTDAGLEYLRGLSNLVILDLGQTQVTDAGLEHLQGLANLESLSLDYTAVTDAGLAHLRQLTRLKRLELDYTEVTEHGIRELQKSLPDCEIDY